MLERTPREDRTEITFVLPADTPPGPSSVVGDFNDWQPGVHTPAGVPTAGTTVVSPKISAAVPPHGHHHHGEADHQHTHSRPGPALGPHRRSASPADSYPAPRPWSSSPAP